MNTKLQNASVPEMGKTVYVENTATTILVKSTIKKENGASLIKRGFKYWQVEKDADNNIILSTVKDTFQTEDIEKGEYSMLLKGLKDGGTYQITSLASNEIGIGYGDTISVNTNKGAGEVKTSDVDDKSVTATTARVEGILSKKVKEILPILVLSCMLVELETLSLRNQMELIGLRMILHFVILLPVLMQILNIML